MKTFRILAVAALLGMAIAGCTNDEGDPEFEILNPEEETRQTQPLQEEKAGQKTAPEH